MALEKLSDILNRASESAYAVGYFEAWDTYSLEAVLETAEEENSPVVLGFGGVKMNQSWIQRFGVKPLGAYGRVIAEKAKVPVAFILNEVLELDHIKQGVSAGFNTVMLDTSMLPYEENIRQTCKVVELARPYDVEVQAELGRLPDFGQDAAGTLTDPDEAAEFVKRTAVDCLSISIGNVHMQDTGKSSVETERVKAIREKVDVPLVIHGGTGFPDEQIAEVIRNGVSLFHVGTVMKKTLFEVTKKVFDSTGEGTEDYQALIGSRKDSDVLVPAKNEIKNIIRKFMKLFGSTGRAVHGNIKVLKQ